MKESQYLIVASNDCIWLSQEVERKLAEGWRRAGGVSVSITCYEREEGKSRGVVVLERYAQALEK